MTRAVLSIGSNIGDSEQQLRAVVEGLGDAVVAVSTVFATAPWGGIDQQDFLNAVVIVDDENTDCRGWLRRGQQLETAAHRERVQRWGPRTVDVDIVVCDDVVSDDPDLILPHPLAHERAFVLAPWLDADPDAVLHGRSVRDLLAELPESERAGVRRTETRLWDPVRCGSAGGDST
ncbi:2-amino-4-hydroxy-6-hydroxymethyldihydropteridine diphosphokinase [Rhodococcus sp. BP-349]|uniref:2-amino-4-hydroxy-6- hydroxymethyldihydropteridine diphosphokinase n=1 Tax=unclassified Rhodococcus (in: high G+C Gram-positive bacteria) TaxID=192944 RepID=UPI001C9B1681|nr:MULTISPECIES: 2-amino-4-hydroxy-6-hydroxymethyldihydropteridine diphosphokinase [unclassified Rhodococcus (in: high G+C Gram-positive bacteria)]MBY6537360.1 2-amino-4-hydroxy-6-hydroxymethyldihydropteridine diphosphokinase [Rhodococcus sp. BP-363]MBY6541697.1 2-amino-4-hydroxy-6-hydroxymethyldihydropteridine diphosphokinase [Rhodococcus sp. BP-369]MBY6560927.1 2-amino-4-hydroxy-6-hydroxymethyldihydropteridine diphosphokinase [Rhodococcus sp. BP-370]MBY6575219.1 2-amino-4-hydroxy-6-hydroxymet